MLRTPAHLPALGANATGPACDDTVHVRMVGVVPSTVFGADLGHKWGQVGSGPSPILGPTLCLGVEAKVDRLLQ